MKKVLICGERSFVGRGLAEKLVADGFEVDVFSRGENTRKGNAVSGDVYTMHENPHFAASYDVVINFIFINKGTIEENLGYIKALHLFCTGHGVKRLIQISSISVYPNSTGLVTETSPIEKEPLKKGRYGAVKMAVDSYLASVERDYEVITVRPGYIVSDEREARFGGIVKSVLPGFGVLLGNTRTSLPLVDKAKVHEGLIRILKKENPLPVYLFLEGKRGTKADYARRYWKGCFIPLPQHFTLFAVRILKLLHIFSSHQENLVRGLFKNTFFDPSESEFDLQMSFSANSVCVIGSGVYGSYTIQRLSEMENPPSVTLYEVGDRTIKDETSAGYGSEIVGAPYTGLQKGRYFGFGGASAKWGGQLLMFTHNDFKHPTTFLKEIVDLNEKYREKVLGRFGIKNSFDEHVVKNDMFTKTGIWLGYFGRNLFKWFKVSKKKILLRPNTRVIRFMYDGSSGTINGLELRTKTGRTYHAYYDRYFLCAGAFESNRIILSSEMVVRDSVHFADQLSQNIYSIKGSLIINGEDYQYGVKGTSLVTKRLVGEIDDVSFFAHPIYNINFPFFQGLKELMFQGKFSVKTVWSVFLDIPSVIGFAWSVFIRRKVFVYKEEWSMGIDLENHDADSRIQLSKDKDEWGVPQLQVDFRIGDKSQAVFKAAWRKVKAYLDEGGVAYTERYDSMHVEKGEDVYHPYGMFMSDARNLEDFYTRYPNLLIVNTGVLPRVGGRNPTAACLPLIEEYVERFM